MSKNLHKRHFFFCACDLWAQNGLFSYLTIIASKMTTRGLFSPFNVVIYEQFASVCETLLLLDRREITLHSYLRTVAYDQQETPF